MDYKAPSFTDKELLKIFPEAKDIIREKKIEYQEILNEIQTDIQLQFNHIYSNVSHELARWILCEWVMLGNEKKIKWYETNLKRLNHLDYLTKHHPGRNTKNITEDDIRAAKDVGIAGLYEGQLRKLGGRLKGLCPFHKEKTGSFFIHLEKNTFNCFGCDAHGDSIDYVQRTQALPFVEAVRYLIGK